MLEALARAAFWSAVYLALVLSPLGLMFLGDMPSPRGFLLEFGVGLGVIGFALICLQFVTTARFRWVAPSFGSDAIIYFHRQAGILALFVVLAHPLVMFVANPEYLAYLDPRVNFLRAVFLTAATLALVLLVVLPLWGLRFGLSYEWWRLTHGLLAAGLLAVGLAHALQVGHYVSGFFMRAGWIAATIVVLGLLVHVRIIKPLLIRRTPYRVVEVVPDFGGVYVLALAPDGHPGMTFEAGQYAWITLGDTPFTLQQHPFSFASSASTTDRIEFCIKESGDFTTTIKDIRPGTRAFLEGPYGEFSLDPRAEAAVFIVGGIGVTPALSMLRTARDRGDRRLFVLFYGNVTRGDIACHDEIASLAAQLNLNVVHVLSDPAPDWTGESGYITEEVLERHLTPVAGKDPQYFICGPPPMMDLVERALLARHVPHSRVLSERFDFI